jgi:luciferase family oxidoreductase group 1
LAGLRLSVLDQSPVPSGTSPADALANSIALARLADRLGYHRFWVAEHHGMAGLASTAPEILLARLTGETARIRLGSGAVLLPHYSPMKVAETFRMLQGLAPGRIDLGIGRAPGGTGLEAYALRRDQEVPVDDFPAKLAELLAFLEGQFPPSHPFGRIHIAPDMPEPPPLWLLGSSNWSAEAAAELGLPYAFAHFINPKPTAGALERYRAGFVPSRRAAQPAALVCLGAVCAASRAEAERLFASARLFRRRVRRNDLRPVPTPEEALAELGPGPDPLDQVPGEPLRYVVGTPESAAADLRRLAAEWQVEELMIVAVLHDHGARMESYRLLAEALALTGG